MTQHYRIHLEEVLTLYKRGELTAMGAIAAYLRIKLKVGWKMAIKVKELRAFFNMPRSTFWNAMHRLQELGEFLFKEESTIVITRCGPNNEQTAQILDNGPNDGTDGPNDGQAAQILDEQPPEPKPDKKSTKAQINSTYFQLYSSFSQADRERFENFCKREANLLPNPPRLIKKWIENNLDSLLDRYFDTYPEIAKKLSQVNQGCSEDKSSAPAASTKTNTVDPVIAESLPEEIKQGLADGRISKISPNWKLGHDSVFDAMLNRWVNAREWINAQLPRASGDELFKIQEQLKALGA